MAQAPGGEGEGAPRKTNNYNKFEGMNSQDGRYGVADNEMFLLENIMRVSPRKLHSVPGPGPIIGQFPPPTSCFPPPQTLTEVAYLGASIDVANPNNCASQMGVFDNTGGEVIYKLTHVNFVDSTTVYKIANGVVTDLGLPAWITGGSIGLCPNYATGESDRPGFVHTHGSFFWDDWNANLQVTISFAGSGTDPNTATRRGFAVFGNFIYCDFATDVGPPNGPCITQHNATTGAWIQKSVAPYDFNVWLTPVSICANASHVFLLFHHNTAPLTPPTIDTILVYNASDLSLVTSFDLSGNTWEAMHMVRDDMIYIIRSAVAPPGPGAYVDIHYVRDILTAPSQVTLCENILLSPGDAVDVGQNFSLYDKIIGGQTFLYYAQSFNSAVHKIGPVLC